MEKQHLVLWRGPCSTQRLAWELISGPDLATRARLLSFNRTQSGAVIGLLTEHNIFRRHLYIVGLSNNPTCRKCGTEEETSAHILCECKALGSLRGELSYLAPLGSQNISAPYFKQCFFRGGGYYPSRLSQTPRLPVPRQR